MDPLERQLLERLRRRDEAAFNELVRAHQSKVFGLVLRMIGDRAEAEDITQEVFVTVFKAIDSFRGDSKLSTWIYRVAINHCSNRAKYLGRRGRGKIGTFEETSSDVPHSVGQGPAEVLEGMELETIIKRALMELEEDQRQLIVLRDIENLSYEEIQEATGLAEGTVKSKLHRGREALQSIVRRLQAGRSTR